MMHVKPKKALGQHFLTDKGVAARIAETALAKPYSHLPLLEIGPGTGVLTSFLLQQDRPLKVIEIDTESVAYLRQAYPDLDIIEGDFLEIRPDSVFDGEFAVIGNYPYNISSQIFFRVLDYRERIPLVSGMLQREVAERICAPAGNRTRGILSVLLHVFIPPPKVKSGVLRLTRNSRTELGCSEKRFRQVVKTAFGQRRKTLRNSLGALIPPGSPLREDPIMGERPERLSVDQFVDLAKRLFPDG